MMWETRPIRLRSFASDIAWIPHFDFGRPWHCVALPRRNLSNNNYYFLDGGFWVKFMLYPPDSSFLTNWKLSVESPNLPTTSKSVMIRRWSRVLVRSIPSSVLPRPFSLSIISAVSTFFLSSIRLGKVRMASRILGCNDAGVSLCFESVVWSSNAAPSDVHVPSFSFAVARL